MAEPNTPDYSQYNFSAIMGSEGGAINSGDLILSYDLDTHDHQVLEAEEMRRTLSSDPGNFNRDTNESLEAYIRRLQTYALRKQAEAMRDELGNDDLSIEQYDRETLEKYIERLQIRLKLKSIRDLFKEIETALDRLPNNKQLLTLLWDALERFNDTIRQPISASTLTFENIAKAYSDSGLNGIILNLQVLLEREGKKPKVEFIRTQLYLLSQSEIPVDEKQRKEYIQRLREDLHETTELLQQEGSKLVEMNSDLPTIVVADLHGRREFVMKVMSNNMEIKGKRKTVLQHLIDGNLNLLFVGDGVHSEKGSDWSTSQGKAQWSRKKPSELREVVSASISTMQMVMKLKQTFPNQVHFVRGNHDYIRGIGGTTDELGIEFEKGGVNQTEAMRETMEYWLNVTSSDAVDSPTSSGDIIDEWQAFEDSLPLMVKMNHRNGQFTIVSHSAPSEPLTREQIRTGEVSTQLQLTLTDNREPPSGIGEEGIRHGVEQTVQNLGAALKKFRWIIGHREVLFPLTCSLQLGNRLIQICDSKAGLVAVIKPGLTKNEVNTYSLNF